MSCPYSHTFFLVPLGLLNPGRRTWLLQLAAYPRRGMPAFSQPTR